MHVWQAELPGKLGTQQTRHCAAHAASTALLGWANRTGPSTATAVRPGTSSRCRQRLHKPLSVQQQSHVNTSMLMRHVAQPFTHPNTATQHRTAVLIRHCMHMTSSCREGKDAKGDGDKSGLLRKV
jgi:hypothetical protein